EKFEAWFKSSFHPDKTGPYIKDQLYFAWKAAGAELVEALEKAQQRITQLESRTVTVSKSDIFNVPGGETYVGGEMISVDTLCLYLAEHGIKWEAE
ncbi:TPA: hypothetical protein ACPT0J_005788, partial [Klebsiella pneumoniae]